MAYGILLSNQVSNPGPMLLKREILTTGPLGKSSVLISNIIDSNRHNSCEQKLFGVLNKFYYISTSRCVCVCVHICMGGYGILGVKNLKSFEKKGSEPLLKVQLPF